MQKSTFRNFTGLEELFRSAVGAAEESRNKNFAQSLQRNMVIEPLECRLLLSAEPNFTADDAILEAAATISPEQFETVYYPSGTVGTILAVNNDGNAAEAFVFPANDSAEIYTLTLGAGVTTTQYTMNVNVVFPSGALSANNFTAQLKNASGQIAAVGTIDGDTISFVEVANTGGSVYKLSLGRTQNTTEPVTFAIRAYQCSLSKAAEVYTQSGTFAKSASSTTNEYSFSMNKNTIGSVCVFAPESQNVTVELYQGSTKIAQAINNSDGYYSIPAFENQVSDAVSTTYTVRVTGGSNVKLESYEITISKNGVCETENNDAPANAMDLIKSGSLVYGSISGVEESLSRTAIDAGQTRSSGYGTAVAYDSNTLAVSTPKLTSGSKVFLFSPNKANDSWTQSGTWAKPSECASDGLFGSSLDISGKWLAVGASGDTVNGVKSGAVYMLNQKTGAYQRIVNPEAVAGAAFGSSVLISGDWLFVSATAAQGGQSASGAVYVYRLNSSGAWTYSQKLVSETEVSIARFGFSMDCDGQTLVIAAPFDSTDGTLDSDGLVYSYSLRGSLWTQSQTLTLSSLDSTPGAAGVTLNDMQFGYSVSIDSGRLAVGCPGYKNGNAKGIVGIFQKDSAGLWNWSDTVYKIDSFVSEFGASVDLTGNQLLVGATGQACAVYVLELSDSSAGQSWGLAAEIDSTGVDNFGQTVIAAGKRIVVSSPSTDSSVTSSQLLQSYAGLADADYYKVNIAVKSGDDATFRLAPQVGLSLSQLDIYLTDEFGNKINSAVTLAPSKGGIFANGTINLPSGSASGTYYLCVQAETGAAGNYTLSVSGSGALAGALKAELETPSGDNPINSMPTELIFKFSDAINVSSLASSKITVNGSKTIALTSANCTLIDGQTISVKTSSISSLTGTISFVFSGVTDLLGYSISNAAVKLVVDSAAPGLTGDSRITVFDQSGKTLGVSNYTGSAVSVQQGAATEIKLVFSDDINLPENAVTVKRWISLVNSAHTEIDFDINLDTANHAIVLTINQTLGDDAYSIQLSDNFVDLAGNKLDSASANWTFFVNSTGSIAMPDAAAGMIDGTLVYKTSVSGNVSQVNETDSFTIRIDNGNMFSLYVVPNSGSTLKPTLTVKNGSSTVSSATASVAGGIAAVEGTKVTSTGYAEYTINVTGASSTTGGYTVYVVLNGIINTAVSPLGKDLSSGTTWYSPSFASSNSVRAKSYITSVLGNYLSDSTTTNQIYKVQITAGDYMSIVLEPGANTGARVGVYSLLTCTASSQIAEGYVNENGLVVIDPLYNTSNTAGTYYIKVSGVSTQYQLTAIRNGVLDAALDSSDLSQSSILKDSKGQVYVYGHASYLSDTLSESQLQTLVESSQGAGISCAIDGKWAAVGNKTDSSSYGTVSVYQKINDQWVLFTTLSGASINAAGFGQSIAIKGNFMAIGAPQSSKDGLISSGAALLYYYNGSSWSLVSTLYPENRASKNGVEFGTEVCLSDGWLAVGATSDIYNGSVCGSVYMYKIDQSGATPTVQFSQQILAGKDNTVSDRDASVCQEFGRSIDISGSWMVIGAPVDFISNTGAAYLFYFDGVHWAQSGIMGSTALSDYGDSFGYDVAIEGTTIAVSAPSHESESGTGAVYIFEITSFGSTPSFKYELHPSVTGTQYFGMSLDLADNQLLVSGWTDSAQTQSQCWIYFLDAAGTPMLYSSTAATSGALRVCADASGAIFAQPGTGTVQAINALSQIDSYKFTVQTSGNIVSELMIPSNNAAGNFTNNLGGTLSYYNSTGTPVYTDSAFAPGDYSADVKAYASKSGDYIYYLAYGCSASPALTGSFELTGFSNGLNNFVQSAVSYIDLSFNAVVNLFTFQSALQSGLVTINGAAVSAANYSVVDGHTIRLTIPSGGKAVNNKYVVSIGAGVVKDAAGRALGATEQTLTIDSAAPTASVSDTTASAISKTITVNFSEALLCAPTPGELSLFGAKSGAISIDAVTYIPSTNRLLIRVSKLPDDYYTLTLNSSSGAFADMAGNWLDGAASQSGIQDYTLNFAADWSGAQTVAYSADNYASIASGAAYQAEKDGYLSIGDSDSYIIKDMPVGENVNISVETTNGMKPTLYVYAGTESPENLLTAEAAGQTSSGAWQYGFSLSIKTDYIIVIKNDSTKAGSYTLKATVNGQPETEALGVNNNTMAAAQPIIGLNLANDSVAIQGNLTSASDTDWYSFTMIKDTWANIYLVKGANDAVSMTLYANNAVVVSGTQTEDFNQIIRNVVETAEEGTQYYLKITGKPGDYDLLISTGSVFNQNSAPAEIWHNNSWAFGSLDKSSGYENTFVLSEIVSSDALGRGAFFGSSVSVDGSWMIVGGRFANQEGISSGYAAIYYNGSAGWTEFQELSPSGISGDNQLGYSVSIKGNIALVSAPFREENGYTGMAYVYELQNGAWVQTTTLSQFGSDVIFGLEVQAVSDTRIAIGSSSQVLYYQKNASGKWVMESGSPLSQNDVYAPENYSLSGFGSSLSVNSAGNTMVVGAAGSDYYVSGSGWVSDLGLAFVYQYNSTTKTWNAVKTLQAQDSAQIAVKSNTGFGSEVLVYGNYVCVSAPRASVGSLTENGAVYIYQFRDGGLYLDNILFGGQDGELFGSSLAMNDSCLVVGSMYYSFNGSSTLLYTGKATVFEKNNFGAWTPQQDVLAGETMVGAFVGAAIALDNNTLAVGAVGQRPANEIDSPRSGVVFAYSTANTDDEYTCYIDATKAINVLINNTVSPVSQLTSISLYYRKADSATEYEAKLTSTSTGWTAAISSALGSGDYVFRIVNKGETSGQYSLRLSNSGIDSTNALKVISATPEYGQLFNYKTESISVTFSEAVRPDLISKALKSVVLTCGGAEIDLKSITLLPDGKTVQIYLNEAYPYKNENIQLTFKKTNFVTLSGTALASDYVLNYTIPLETVAVTSQTTITDQLLKIDVTFDENVVLSDGAPWKNVVSFKAFYQPTGEFLDWTPVDLHFAYNSDTHTISITSADVLTDNTEYRLYLDGNKIFGAETGEPLSGLVDNKLVIPFIKSDSSITISAIVNTSAETAADLTGQSTTLAPASWIDEWQGFYLELWAQADSNSVGEINLQMSYDTNLFCPETNQEGTFVYESGTAFSGTNGSFTVKQVNGLIIVSAKTTIKDLGQAESNNQVFLGKIKFVPTPEGKGVAITAYDTGIAATTGITVSSYNLGRTFDSTAVNQNVVQTTTEVWPVIFDANDSNAVDLDDFIDYALQFGAATQPGTGSWYTDYDSSGSTDLDDFISFALNFGTSRYDNSVRTYPENFIENFKARSAAPAALPELPVPAVNATVEQQQPEEIVLRPAASTVPIAIEQIQPLAASNSLNISATITLEREAVLEEPQTVDSFTVNQAAIWEQEDESLFDWDDALADSAPKSADPIAVALEELFE